MEDELPERDNIGADRPRNRGNNQGNRRNAENWRQRAGPNRPLRDDHPQNGAGYQQGHPRHNRGYRGNLNNNEGRGPRRPYQDRRDPAMLRDENLDNMRDYQGNQRNLNTRIRFIGFKTLEEMAMSDPRDILAQINQRKESFLNLINSQIDRQDVFVLVIEILSKVCQSSFDELKLRLILEVCNSQFIPNLRNYLMDLPYVEVKARNRSYWDNPNKFWKNFVTFCDSVFNMAPSVALQKCRSLMEGTSKCCFEELNQRHNFTVAEEISKNINELRERITLFENKKEEENQKNKKNAGNTSEENEPPENFRDLSVIPSRDDLLNKRPYLRANIVDGSYNDVEHYLDVQFRLLREDCFGPLRDGILQYLQDPQQKKFDNIRVYRNVKFVGPYVSNSKIGHIVQLDSNTMKRFKRINWSHSKRFIFGSLLLFSNDNCRTLITATILDRDVKYLSQGMIPVTLVQNTENAHHPDENIFNDESYLMIESEVYFEPYFHVLKALQDPNFPRHLAMSKYIVKVDPDPKPPAYLNEQSIFQVETQNSLDTEFVVLNTETWPTQADLGLNESQYEAYKLALTHEFAVIQGPPGTGKTFLGVKVAKTLLENLTSDNRSCLMLVICYTNHALDQFLEFILTVTNSIVRIGSQSRNEAMEEISLNNLRRKKCKEHSEANHLYYSERNNLKMLMTDLQTAQKRLDSLSNGILAYNSILEYVPEIEALKYYYHGHEDILRKWLFENMELVNVDQSVIDDTELDIMAPVDVEADQAARLTTHLDDIFEDQEINGIEVKTSFMLHDAERTLRYLVSQYKSCEDRAVKQKLEFEIIDFNSRIALFTNMQDMYKTRGVPRNIRERENLMRLSNVDRWSMYFTWATTAINKIRGEIRPLQEKVNSAVVAYEEARMNLDLKMLNGVKVIGMTTSGAARLRKLLQALAPPIVIVEEAAEVLEQHIVTSLTMACQHLILIGDHQQLRPSAAHMRLARHFNIEVSLFERMIMNSMHSRRLGVQHRMRPEIAALISPHIYPDLMNHPSVEAFPQVRGVTTNLFFFTHNFKEDAVEDSASKSNHKEADMTLALANYLMQQGYEPQDVTILAAYSGQMFYMRKERGKYAFLDKVKITVVDNYQGEESKIILLSLVRNNDQNRIGFLGTENRICVALSRAKEGFYIFGNIDILKANSELWAKIDKTLASTGSIGPDLRLKCQNHPTQITTIATVQDFEKVPEGGCLLKCNFNLPACGHRCPQICHGYDRSHTGVNCQLKCERVLCELGHVCPLRCAAACRPCQVPVLKQLPCGHELSVPCHRDPADVKCTHMVEATLPDCGHETRKPCHLDVKRVPCTVPCVYRVQKCGHECRRRCHVNDDPHHEKYVCEKPCAKARKGCTAELVGDRGDHQCPRMCHQDCDDCNVEVTKKRSNCKHSEKIACCKNVDEKPCRKNCARALPCGHYCKKKCNEPCGDCKQEVTKVIPDCNHSIKVACKVEVNRGMCKERCERKLECGHPCRDRCDQVCDRSKCNEIVPKNFDSPCGHKVMLPCNVYARTISGQIDPKILLSYCTEPCNEELKCNHLCRGNCSKCHQGRLHAPCTQTCHVPLICGHECEEPCNQVCPPCKKRCEVKCPHSKCDRLCGAPCVSCQEKCKRSCVHGACSRRCGEPCGRPPCDAACPRALPCGHPCRGLCGEPCPDVCKLCDPDRFPKDFLGGDFEDDTKFITLQDCSHVMSVEDADNLMAQREEETVTIRSCPFCRKPIINTYRYKDRVNSMYKNEINPIKEKVYGTEEKVALKRLELIEKVKIFQEKHIKVIEANLCFKIAVKKLLLILKRKSHISLLQLEVHFLYLDILDMIGEYSEKFNKANLTELKEDFLEQMKLICQVLTTNIQKISQQQQQDIGNEIKRMNALFQLSKILSHQAYKSTQSLPKVAEAAKQAKSSILTWKLYSDDVATSALKQFEDIVKVSGIVTKEERDLIVKAIGLKQGHWYKCPNGHFYCIGECGGAMQISRCNECGARIGGQSHSLLRDNEHAPEMDGSRFAAWSEQYNNMANFDL